MKRKMDQIDNEFHNRNLIRSEEHLSISVNNVHSNLDALNKRQNPKIEASKSTTKSDRIYSGLNEYPRLQCKKTVNQRNYLTEFIIKNSQKLNEQKNEILSRTFDILIIKKLLRIFYYVILILLIINTQCGVDSAPLKTNDTSLINNRTLEHSLAKRHITNKKDKKFINKNCKEYDITSRAYLSDLIFEGTARTRSSSTSGRYDVTFVIQKILKQTSNNTLKPKSQIRLHFGGKANRKSYRNRLINDCPINGIRGSKVAKANVKVGGKYYVFAERFGPMNYTAKGEPIVINKRNLKSIRSVLSKNRVKPPRVRGLQDSHKRVGSELRLTCQIKGRPVPRITWYKDGRPFIPLSHVNVTYYRRNSTIQISHLQLQDGGRYECKANSVIGKAAMSAYVNVSQFYTENTTSSTTTDSDWPLHAEKCQVDAFCLNGGKCRFISSIGEHMCICEVGFTGARCENKDVSTRGFYPDPPEGGLKRLYRRRVRGNLSPLMKSQYWAMIRSYGDHKKLRHWFNSQKDHNPGKEII